MDGACPLGRLGWLIGRMLTIEEAWPAGASRVLVLVTGGQCAMDCAGRPSG
jgi:hypothetical protein